MSQCLSWREVEALAEGAGDASARQHAAHCGRCSRRLAAEMRYRQAAAALASDTAPAAPDELRAAVAEAKPSRPLSCRRVLRLLDLYLDGYLRFKLLADFESHLFTCRSCYAAYRQALDLRDALASLAEAPPDGLLERVRASVAATSMTAPVPARPLVLVRSGALAAAAAFAALLIGTVLWMRQPSPGPSVGTAPPRMATTPSPQAPSALSPAETVAPTPSTARVPARARVATQPRIPRFARAIAPAQVPGERAARPLARSPRGRTASALVQVPSGRVAPAPAQVPGGRLAPSPAPAPRAGTAPALVQVPSTGVTPVLPSRVRPSPALASAQPPVLDRPVAVAAELKPPATALAAESTTDLPVRAVPPAPAPAPTPPAPATAIAEAPEPVSPGTPASSPPPAPAVSRPEPAPTPAPPLRLVEATSDVRPRWLPVREGPVEHISPAPAATQTPLEVVAARVNEQIREDDRASRGGWIPIK